MVRSAYLAALTGFLACASFAQAQSPVKFPAEAVEYSRPGNPKQTILYRPSGGSGPFPAVVLLHTCGGVGQHVHDWAERFTRDGYAALVLDVLTPRNVANNCKPAWQADVSLDAANADVAAALAHLRSLPFIKGDSLAVVGFSFGAIATIKLSDESYRARIGSLPGLKAVAFFYGACATPSQNPTARAAYAWPDDIDLPVIAFLGAIDNEAPAKPCVEAAERLRAKGRPVSYKVYPDTTHSFDEPRWGTQGQQIMHGTRGPFLYRFNPQARDDAWREMKTLFDAKLKDGN